MRVKEKESFLLLDISNSYQGLNTDDYFTLKEGGIVTISTIPKICQEHLMEIKPKIIKKRKK